MNVKTGCNKSIEALEKYLQDIARVDLIEDNGCSDDEFYNGWEYGELKLAQRILCEFFKD